MSKILDVPDGIPKDLSDKAKCVAVFPSVKKFAISIGRKYGRGGANHDGLWGAPAVYALEGGNIGFQLGGEATDFILLIMNSEGANSVLSSKVKLGADASAAAGPKGRVPSAETDIAMKAEILSYSRSRGLFGGVSREGWILRSDGGANKALQQGVERHGTIYSKRCKIAGHRRLSGFSAQQEVPRPFCWQMVNG
jgi:SH3 domain-containing YSC84-like protein 1